MDVISNENNLDQLREQCETLEEGVIRIASGWIRSEYLRRVLTETVQDRIRNGLVELYVLFRIGSPQDVKITDPGVFSFLQDLAEEEKSTVEWRFSTRHHAKMYLIGNEWGMLGSFNLTGGGFGNDERPGSNPEAGIITTKKGELRSLRQRFDEMWGAAREMEKRLLGFVANPSTNDSFVMVGVEPLSAGKFVEITLSKNEFILAKVERSYRYNEHFFFVQNEQMPDAELFRQLAGKKKLQNQANGIAFAGDNAEYQLNIAEVKPLNLIKRREDEQALPFRFEPVNIPPAVASPVNSASEEHMREFFNPSNADFAVLEENTEVEVSFKDEEILSKHFAVLGSTGSGKSYFVKKYLSRHLCPRMRERGLRVVIIDTHGEYSGEELKVGEKGCSAREILGERKVSAKAEAMHLEDIEDVKEYFGSPNKQEKEILWDAFDKADSAPRGKRQERFQEVLRAQLANIEQTEELEWSKVLDALAEVTKETADDKEVKNSPLRNKIDKHLQNDTLVKKTDDAQLKKTLSDRLRTHVIEEIKKEFPTKESTSKLLRSIIDKIDSGDYRLDTLDLVATIHEPGLYRLDLSPIDDPDTRRAVVGDLLQEVFEKAKQNRGKFDTLFVIDEAQNYAPEPASKKIPSYRWMKIIASEGRKFGVGLLVISQRPQYLSKDVLTQCNTQAIFRLINKADLSQIENAIEGISEHDINQLPNFVAGQAIFTGVGMQMPVRVRVKG